MYDAGMLTLSILLLTAGGWLRTDAFDRRRIAVLVSFSVLLPVCLIPPISVGAVSIYPASLLLTALALVSQRTGRPLWLSLLILTAGLAGWQLAEWFPAGQFESLWILAPALLLAAATNGDDGTKRLLFVLSPYCFAGCRTLMDRFLFGYAVVPIGTPEGLTASLLGLLLFEIGRTVQEWMRTKQPAKNTGCLGLTDKHN